MSTTFLDTTNATSGAVSYAGLSTDAFAAQNAPWAPSSRFGSGGSSGLPIFDIPGYSSTNTLLLSTPGRTYLASNIYSGSGMTVSSPIRAMTGSAPGQRRHFYESEDL